MLNLFISVVLPPSSGPGKGLPHFSYHAGAMQQKTKMFTKDNPIKFLKRAMKKGSAISNLFSG